MTEDSITYDPSSDLYYLEFSLDGPDSVADAVVFGAAEILDEEAVSLPPLGDVVDTDSLTRIFHSAGDPDPGVSVSFEYDTLVVTVQGHGRITFEERD